MADDSPSGDVLPWSGDPVSVEGLSQQTAARKSHEATCLSLEPPPVAEPTCLADLDPNLQHVRAADLSQRRAILLSLDDDADRAMAEAQAALSAASWGLKGRAPAVVQPSDAPASGEA